MPKRSRELRYRPIQQIHAITSLLSQQMTLSFNLENIVVCVFAQPMNSNRMNFNQIVNSIGSRKIWQIGGVSSSRVNDRLTDIRKNKMCNKNGKTTRSSQYSKYANFSDAPFEAYIKNPTRRRIIQIYCVYMHQLISNTLAPNVLHYSYTLYFALLSATLMRIN